MWRELERSVAPASCHVQHQPVGLGAGDLDEACEHLEFYPRFSRETVTYDYIGGMMSFGETFGSRIGRWIEQNLGQVSLGEIDGSGEDALKAQLVIEAAIESWQTNSVVTL